MTNFRKNTKHTQVIFIALLILITTATCAQHTPISNAHQMTRIRVVMDNNYPPYIFLDEQGVARGILVDQWALWEKHSGVQVEIYALPWDEALNGMKDGKFDVIDTIFQTPEREKLYDFTNAYARIDVSIFFHNNISGLANVSDLKGFRVAVKSGDADAEYLENQGITNLIYYNSYEEIIQAASKKEENIFVIDQSPGLYFLYKYGLQNKFNYSAPLFSGEFHRAVKKGDTALLNLVTSGFSQINKTEYEAIEKRWMGAEQNAQWQKYLPYLLPAALIGLTVILILIIFAHALQKKVDERAQELNQALADLQKSESNYREIFNATTEAIFIHTAPDGRLLHVNQSMLRMYGYDSEEDALANEQQIFNGNSLPYTKTEADKKIRKAQEEGPQVFEWHAKKKNGELFWVEVSLRSLQIGGEDQLIAVVRDISQRRETDEELRQSEERYRTLFNNMMDGIYRSTHAGKFIEVNPALVSMFGYASKEEMLTLDIAQELYFTPEERGSHILNTNQAGVDIYRMRRKDGSTIWVEDHGYYIHDKQGNILYHEGILRDISARKQAEDETSQRLMELETLYESGLTINQLPDPQQIGQKVIDLLKQKLGWSQANIRLYHPQKENQEQPEIENDTALEAPMRYGGEWIGALALTADKTNPAERAFTEADKRLLSLFASQAAGAIHSARLRKQTARQLDQLQALHLIDRAISSSFDLRTILNTVISQTITQLKVDAANILLYHPSLQTLDYIAGQGFNSHNIEKTHLRLGECLAGQAAFERRTTHSHNLPQDGSKFRRTALLEGEKFLEYYAVPLIAKGEVKGVLEVFNRTPLPMDAEWLDFLETLAGQAAIAINQTHLFEDLQRANFELIAAYDATIEGWARAMDLRDRETENHTRRVTEMSVTLAKAMGIKDSELISIRRGALLHDIGKIGVPDNILLKEGALNAKEWEIMRQHPQFAYEMIKPIKYLRQSLDIPYCHHEKWDGTGYPRGLKGEQIPLAARIFAVVDVWDAVTIDRPYRAGWTKESAIQYIREQSAKHFDPRVVEVFLKIIA